MDVGSWVFPQRPEAEPRTRLDVAFRSELFWRGTEANYSCPLATFVAWEASNLSSNAESASSGSSMPLKEQSNSAVMKPAVDEMFPEGAGPYVDLDEVGQLTS